MRRLRILGRPCPPKTGGLWKAGVATLAAAALLAGPGAGHASGPRIDEQGAVGTALGGAFTAQADDPSAIYYNPGGLGFLQKGGVIAGTSVQTVNEFLFQGLSPGDAAGTSGELDTSNEILLHAYWAKPLTPNVVVGLGAFQPFFMKTQWADEGSFAGRLDTTAAELTTYDVNGALSLRLTRSFSLGVGAVYRTAEIGHDRRLARFNPLSNSTEDVATVSLETDQEGAFGWNAGFVYRPSPAFSFGVSYRSAIDQDYDGAALLTQIATGDAQFDQLVAASLPFGVDLPVATSLELPATARVGLAFGLGQNTVLELGGDWTAWSSVDAVAFDFLSEPSFDQTIDLDLDDAVAFRLGLRLKNLSGSEWRFGAVFDESAQPTETFGPFWADVESASASVGWGKDWLGIALKWTELTETSVRNSATDFNGTYSGNRWSITLSIAP